MKTEKVNYQFVAVPAKLNLLLDDKCSKMLNVLLQLHFAFADENDMFYSTIEQLVKMSGLSKRVLNAVLVTLNRYYIIDVYSVGQSRGKQATKFRINFDVIDFFDNVEFNVINEIDKIQTINYTDKDYKVEYQNLSNLITKSNSEINLQILITKIEINDNQYLQNLITKSTNLQNLITKLVKVNHNIYITIYRLLSNNKIKFNIDHDINNNVLYNNIVSDENLKNRKNQVEENNKVNCYISNEEIEQYDNSNSRVGNNFISNETINNNDNSNCEGGKDKENSGNNNSDNSNEVNRAVLSCFSNEDDKLVISDEKMPETGLKQAKTRNLTDINKSVNSNTIIIDGETCELGDMTIEEFVDDYYKEVMDILNPEEFDKERNKFCKFLNSNKLYGEKYDKLCDRLDAKMSKYQVSLNDKQVEKAIVDSYVDYSESQILEIKKGLLSECLSFTASGNNSINHFIELRSQYRMFVQYNNIQNSQETKLLNEKYQQLKKEYSAIEKR